jgi:hypothetical protein
MVIKAIQFRKLQKTPLEIDMILSISGIRLQSGCV